MLEPEQKTQFRKFFFINLVASLLLFAAYGLSLPLLPKEYLSPMIPFIILFFMLINLLVFFFKLKILKSNDIKFINLFLILNSLKMLLFITIIALYAFFFRSDAIEFAVSFFICYAVFTFLLVSHFNKLHKASL